MVRRFFGGSFDQEEAFQEVWMQLYRVRGRFDVNRYSEFVAWARRVARNRCLDLLKSRARRQEVFVEQMEPLCAPSQMQALTDTQLRQAIAQFVSLLDSEQQHFFELCFIKELSHHSIANTLGITIRRSKYLKKKILARLLKNALLRRICCG